MTDLHLTQSEQAAVRAVIASEPVPGTALPGECALQHLAGLIPCDAVGIALLDRTGSAVQNSSLPRDRTPGFDLPAAAAAHLGIRQLDRGGDSPSARGVAVLSLGVRNGTYHVVWLWLLRRTSGFTARDRALLELVAPALARVMRERPTAVLPTSLTVAERRVLRQVAAGLSNADIAERLSIAPCTVRKHLEHAYRKLGVTNRLAAVLALDGGRPLDLVEVEAARG